MKSQISVRLSEDVIQAITKQAEAEGRNRNQQIEWMLRKVLQLQESGLPVVTIGTEVRKLRTPEEADKVDEEYNSKRGERYHKCSHGGNEYTCERVACKIKTGRA